MEYLRKTVNSNTLTPLFDLPLSLRNRRVEVIILPIDNGAADIKERKSAKGRLKKYANPDLISQEKTAWSSAAEEKYANH